MQLSYSIYTAMGNRPDNQDSAQVGALGRSGLYAIVADGLGGHGGGRQASQIALQALLSCQGLGRLPEAREIVQWMALANREILSARLSPTQMKTTAVCLFLEKNRAIWAHIGDSRLYHFVDGVLKDYTLDHSVCQVAVMLGEITRREIPGHPDRNRLLKVLGDETAAPEVHAPVTLSPGQHAFLLCSDGLWERLVEEEIQLDLHKSPTPDAWLDFLRRRAEKRKSTDVDNNTAIAVFLDL